MKIDDKIIFNCCENPSVMEQSFGTTCMDFPPIYDKYGNNTNPNRNTTTYHLRCWNCKKEWREER